MNTAGHDFIPEITVFNHNEHSGFCQPLTSRPDPGPHPPFTAVHRQPESGFFLFSLILHGFSIIPILMVQCYGFETARLLISSGVLPEKRQFRGNMRKAEE